MTNTIKDEGENALGAFLRDRRMRLDPVNFGLPTERRRTPGLRREEVAQRAHVSATWYAWLEQGRGGAPSAAALGRLATALALSDAERDHLFSLAQRRPGVGAAPPRERVSPVLRQFLDALTTSPAMVRNELWDVLAWNQAAAAVFVDYSMLPADKRNILRLLFTRSDTGTKLAEWEKDARYIVASFKAHLARSGATERAAVLVAELRSASADFNRLWQTQDVWSDDEGVKTLYHPDAGTVSFDYVLLLVDGHPGLALTIFSPRTAFDKNQVEQLLACQSARQTTLS